MRKTFNQSNKAKQYVLDKLFELLEDLEDNYSISTERAIEMIREGMSPLYDTDFTTGEAA